MSVFTAASIPEDLGEEMYRWAEHLFPINRSITGPGVRETLSYISKLVENLEVHSVPSGTHVFDWEIPVEWMVHEAWIEDPTGKRIVDFAENNLHLVGYSESVDQFMDLSELQHRLHSLPDQPNAIPYVTSYYERRWGFCITHNFRMNLQPGQYRVKISSTLAPGYLNYGEIFIPGVTDKEVLLSTYVCHPSLANNELSGPVVVCALVRWLQKCQNLRYSYRIVFVPETIGSLTFISRNLDRLKNKVIAGYNVTCVGDERTFSYLPSRDGDSISDKVAKHVLSIIHPNFRHYSWLDRGSDERQYCAPGIDLPIATIMRSKYGTYPEYHTSLDNLNLISSQGLLGSFEALRLSIDVIERNAIPLCAVLGEPFLSKRGMYPTLSAKNQGLTSRSRMDLISFSDGKRSLLEISDLIGVSFWEARLLAEELMEAEILELKEPIF